MKLKKYYLSQVDIRYLSIVIIALMISIVVYCFHWYKEVTPIIEKVLSAPILYFTIYSFVAIVVVVCAIKKHSEDLTMQPNRKQKNIVSITFDIISCCALHCGLLGSSLTIIKGLFIQYITETDVYFCHIEDLNAGSLAVVAVGLVTYSVIGLRNIVKDILAPKKQRAQRRGHAPK